MEKDIDFSKRAISKEVVEYIVAHPLAWFPLTLGVLGVMAFLLNILGGVFLFVALGFCGLGILGWVVNLARKDALESKIISRLTEQLDRQKTDLIKRLMVKLREFNEVKNLSLYSGQAEIQFEKVRKKFERFREMLGEKLDPTELTYGRFLGTVEQVYLAVLDRLESVVRSLETMNSVDVDYIEARMKHLDSLAVPEPADQREMETLRTRLDLREKNRVKVNELLTENEEAMTQIDQSMSAIAEARTIAGRASIDLEYAREELVQLTERIQKHAFGG